MAMVFEKYGNPLEVVRTRDDEPTVMTDDQTLYRASTWCRIFYPRQGLLFWFDAEERVHQFVVHPITPND